MFRSDRMKLLREARGLSRPELALLVGVNPEAVWHWEQGSRLPHGPNLVKLASVLRVSVGYIFPADDLPEAVEA